MDKSNRRHQENNDKRLVKLERLKSFLNLGVFWDYETNPKMERFRQNEYQKKELEKTIIERRNHLSKIKEHYDIRKNIYETTKKAFLTKIISKIRMMKKQMF